MTTVDSTPATEAKPKPEKVTEAKRFEYMGEELVLETQEEIDAFLALLKRHRRDAQALLRAKKKAFESEEEIKQLQKGHEAIVIDGERYVTWQWAGETKFDKRGLQEEHPELVEKYTTRTTDTKRVFKVRGVVGVD